MHCFHNHRRSIGLRHKGIDGTRLVNYAQWQSREAFEAMLQNPEAQMHMRQAAAVVIAEPQQYTGVYSNENNMTR